MNERKKPKLGIIIAIAVPVILVAVCAVFFLTGQGNKVSINQNESTMVFTHKTDSISEPLTAEEAETVKNIFNGKELHDDNPSCGFTENIGIKFGGSVFMPANDGDDIIGYNGKFFTLTDEEIAQIHDIMLNHGAYFPCV